MTLQERIDAAKKDNRPLSGHSAKQSAPQTATKAPGLSGGPTGAGQGTGGGTAGKSLQERINAAKRDSRPLGWQGTDTTEGKLNATPIARPTDPLRSRTTSLVQSLSTPLTEQMQNNEGAKLRRMDELERQLKQTETEKRLLDLETPYGAAKLPKGWSDPGGVNRRGDELTKKQSDLQNELDALEIERRNRQYEALRTNADFAEKSRYIPTRKSEEEIEASRGPLSILVPETRRLDYGDITYDYINRDPQAMADQSFSDVKAGLSAAGLDDSERLEMNRDEIALFNYIYATKSPEAAYQYVKDLTSELNDRQRRTEVTQWGKYASEHPVQSSAFSVLTSPARGLSYLGQAADYLSDGKIDQNAGYNKFSYIPSAIRGQVSQDVEKYWVDRGHEFGGKTASFLYQTGMSMGDFLLNSLVTGALGGEALLGEAGAKKAANLTLAIMGTGAAADATIAAKDRKLTDDQAFTLGTIAGLAEVVTEKVSLEALLKPDWEKGVLNYIIKNAVAEGSEEVASDLINLVADVLVSKDKSEWAKSIRAYMNEGHSEAEATGLAVKDQLLSMGLDFLGGALSGGIMSGVAGAGHVMTNYQSGRQLNALDLSGEDIQAFVNEGLASDPSTQAYKLATAAHQKLAAGGTLTNYELGNLYQANIRAVAAEAEAGGDDVTPSPADTDDMPDVEPDTKAALWRAAVEMDRADASGTVDEAIAFAGAVTEETQLGGDKVPVSSDPRGMDLIDETETGLARPSSSVTDTKATSTMESAAMPTTAQVEGSVKDDTIAFGREAVERFTKDLSPALATTLREMYNEYQEPAAYLEDMMRAHKAGREGITDPRAVFGPRMENAHITLPQAQAAILAGQSIKEDTGYEGQAQLAGRDAEGYEGGYGAQGPDVAGGAGAVQSAARSGGLVADYWDTASGGRGRVTSPRAQADYLESQARGHKNTTIKGYMKDTGLEVVVTSDEAWRGIFGQESLDHRDAKSLGGKIYLPRSCGEWSQNELRLALAHEGTHAMKQVGYQPYLDLLGDVGGYLNFGNARTQDLFLDLCEHTGVTMEQFMDDPKTQARVYDELCATLSGHTAIDQFVGNFGGEETSLLDFFRSEQEFDTFLDRLRQVQEAFHHQKEVQGHGTEAVHLRNGGQRADGAHPGGQVRQLEGGAGQDQSGDLQGRPADAGAAALAHGRKVSTASLGIGMGSNSDGIYIVNRGADTPATAAARKLARERGLRLTLFVGNNLSIKKGGTYASVRGYVSGDRVFIRADHPEFTADQIMRHEAGHNMIAKGEVDPDMVRERISEKFGQEKIDRVASLYEVAYRGTGLTSSEVWEETVCDSLGDMNIFSETVHEGEAQELLEEVKKAASAEQETRRNRGPPAEIGKLIKEDGRNGRKGEVRTGADSDFQEEAQGSDQGAGKENQGVRREFSASSGRHREVNPDFGEKPVRTWAEGHVVEPSDGSTAYVEQQIAMEYGVASFVISDEEWTKNKGDTLAFAAGGQVYLRENLPQDKEGMFAPHEITHVMRQKGYTPYLDFVERTPSMLNMSDPYTQAMLRMVAKHQGATLESADPALLYDEFNATMYGHIATGKVEMFQSGDGENVFNDFEAYAAELTAIHEQFKAENSEKSKFSMELPMEQSAAKRYGLTEDETAALLTYKSSESYKVNAKLRDGLSLTSEEQKMVSALDKALEKLPKVKGTVYRTVSFDDLSDADGELATFLVEHKEGNTVVYPAYTSTSTRLDGYPLSAGTKFGAVLEITGENARLLDGFGNNFEYEALFPRDTVFHIATIEQDDDGIYHMQMKEDAENAGEGQGRVGSHSQERSENVQRVQEEGQVLGDLQGVSETDTLGSSEERLPGVRGDGGEVSGDKAKFSQELEGIEALRREEFRQDLATWNKEGRPTGESFILGSTGPVLQGLGAIESDIYMEGDKINTILHDHPEMTLLEIQRIPDILEDPVLVLKSNGSSRAGQNTRLVLFGSVKAQNGQPVMCVLDLRPVEGRLVIQDMQKVNSSYTRDNALNYVQSSEIMHADKKRAIPLLRSIGLHGPIELQQNGSMGSITYKQRSVNLSGVPFSEVVKAESGGEYASQELPGIEALRREDRRLAQQARKEGWSDARLRQERLAAAEKVFQYLIEEYGAIPAGESPARSVQVPRRTSGRERVSQTVRTILEAKATPGSAIPSIQELVVKGEFSYETVTDKEAIARAERTITDRNWGSALAEWKKDMAAGKVSKDHTAMGWALYNNAANSGNLEMAMDILQEMVKSQRSAAQALQATRILKQLSPEAQLYGVVQSVEGLQKELNERYGETDAPELKIDEDLGRRLLEARTQEERDAALRDIYRDIGRQMPSRLRDKWNAWRYLSMLGNPRTHVRNIVGNAGFAPVVMAKDLVATAIEKAVSAVSGGGLERSKALVGLGKADRALLSAAWADYASVEEAALGGGKYSDLQSANRYIEEGRVIFRGKAAGKALETARKANSYALDVEDIWFSKPHYAYALAQFCKAHKITEAEIRRGNPQVLAAARNYAVKEAQKATYRDANALSQTVSRLGRDMTSGKNPVSRGLGVLAEGILPFRKTPANILARGLEYSPLGLLKGLGYDLGQVRRGNMTGAEAIDNISAGLTGTGLLALGLYLAAQGLVRGRGKEDDKERELAELQGHQNYSMELPDGRSITLDWLAPEALPFFVGVNLWEVAQSGEGNVTLAQMLEAVGNVSEPMLEMSCLQSLNDALEVGGRVSSDGLGVLPAVLVGAASSYLTQGLPTLLGQLERVTEKERESTYTEKNAFLTPDMQYTLGKVSGKVPGWEFQQIPYIDAWGRHESNGGVGARAFHNLLNPAYTSQIEESPMEQELLRLYRETGEAGVLPKRAAKTVVVNGQARDLMAKEYVRYAEQRGQVSLKLVTALTESKLYAGLEDAVKAECVVDAYTYANQVARSAIDNGANVDAWVTKARQAEETYRLPVATYILLRNGLQDIGSLKDKNGEAIDNSRGLLIMQKIYEVKGLNDEQRRYLFEAFGVGKSVSHYNRTAVEEALERMVGG